ATGVASGSRTSMRPVPTTSRSEAKSRTVTAISAPSATDSAHGPARVGPVRVAHPVPGALGGHRGPKDVLELVVVGPGAERLGQAGLPLGEEAGAELAVGREAQAVAARAERLGDRGHELELPCAVGEAPARGRRRGPFPLHGTEGPPAADHLAKLPS